MMTRWTFWAPFCAGFIIALLGLTESTVTEEERELFENLDSLRPAWDKILLNCQLPELEIGLSKYLRKLSQTLVDQDGKPDVNNRLLSILVTIDLEPQIDRVLLYLVNSGFDWLPRTREELQKGLVPQIASWAKYEWAHQDDDDADRETFTHFEVKDYPPSLRNHLDLRKRRRQLLPLCDTESLKENILDLLETDEAVQNFVYFLSGPEMAAAYYRLISEERLGVLLKVIFANDPSSWDYFAGSFHEAVLGWYKYDQIRIPSIEAAVSRLHKEEFDVEHRISLHGFRDHDLIRVSRWGLEILNISLSNRPDYDDHGTVRHVDSVMVHILVLDDHVSLVTLLMLRASVEDVAHLYPGFRSHVPSTQKKLRLLAQRLKNELLWHTNEGELDDDDSLKKAIGCLKLLEKMEMETIEKLGHTQIIRLPDDFYKDEL